LHRYDPFLTYPKPAQPPNMIDPANVMMHVSDASITLPQLHGQYQLGYVIYSTKIRHQLSPVRFYIIEYGPIMQEKSQIIFIIPSSAQVVILDQLSL